MPPRARDSPQNHTSRGFAHCPGLTCRPTPVAAAYYLSLILFTGTCADNGVKRSPIQVPAAAKDSSPNPVERGDAMQRTIQYALHESIMLIQVMAVSNLFWHTAKRVLAILTVLLVTYGLIAAEVELAKPEQITAPYPR
jgi:hypothetical protein